MASVTHMGPGKIFLEVELEFSNESSGKILPQCVQFSRLAKNDIDHVPTTQLHCVRHSLELLDLTNTNLSTICTSEFYPMTFLKKLFINDIQFLSKIEKSAFDSLENLEFFEMKNNPLLDFIDPKAFYDAKLEVCSNFYFISTKKFSFI